MITDSLLQMHDNLEEVKWLSWGDATARDPSQPIPLIPRTMI